MDNIKSKIESLLFISAKPMTISQLSGLLKKSPKEVGGAGDELVEDYKRNGGGIQIIKNGSKYQMVSSPENAHLVQEFIKDETTGELSRPSLEALTIIAYRGPITKIELDRIRGVNCALIIRNLLLRGLIEGRADKIKKETYYRVTLDFIRFLGINDIKELPDYEKLNQDDTIDRVLAGSEEGQSGPAADTGLSDGDNEEVVPDDGNGEGEDRSGDDAAEEAEDTDEEENADDLTENPDAEEFGSDEDEADEEDDDNDEADDDNDEATEEEELEEGIDIVSGDEEEESVDNNAEEDGLDEEETDLISGDDEENTDDLTEDPVAEEYGSDEDEADEEDPDGEEENEKPEN
ncbi:MAG: SMC-Scp complex subunit ScpB [Candidatus Falkowbacteria bacterium]